MLSLFEVFQLICELCDYGIHNCRKDRNKAKKKRKKQNARDKKEREARQLSLRQKGFNGLRENYSDSGSRNDDRRDETHYRKVYDDISPYTIYTGKPSNESRY